MMHVYTRIRPVLYPALIIFLSTCFSFRAAAGNELGFQPTSLKQEKLNKTFLRYTIVRAEDEGLVFGQHSTLRIVYGKPYEFELEDSRLLAENYKLRLRDDRGVRNASLEETGFDGHYYTSRQVTPGNALAFSTFRGQYYLYVRSGGEEFYVEPLSTYVAGADNDLYVYYTPDDLAPVDTRCEADFSMGGAAANKGGGNGGGGNGGGTTCYMTELAIACDYSMYSKYGSVNGVLHRTINVTNLTRTDYKITSGLNQDIGFKIVEHYVVTCATCNPWPYTTNISKNLDSVRVNGPTLFVNTFDLAQYWWDNPNYTSGMVGLAYIGTVCSGYKYNTVMDWSNNYSLMRCTNTHEIGHNFNCQHDTTGGMIMSPNVTNTTTWSAPSVSSITGFLPIITCLSPCPSTVALCDTLGVNNITVLTNTAQSNVVVKWTGTSGVSYKARLYNYSTATWTAFTNVAAGVDSVLFGLPGVCTAKLQVEIVPVCPVNLPGGSKMVVFNYNAAVVPYVTISTPSTTVCPGAAVTFTATGNFNPNTTFQWKLNGNVVGTNSAVYTASTLNTGDMISCEVTANVPCASEPKVTSNTITMTVSNDAAPVFTVAASPSVVCAGSTSTLTASGTAGLSYSWSPAATLSSSSGASVAATPVSNTTYTVVATNGSGCTSSQTVTVSVVAIGTWIGVTSTDWFTNSNWCGNVPTASTNVVIPPTAPFMPVLNGATTVNSFVNNGHMTVGPNGLLTIQ